MTRLREFLHRQYQQARTSLAQIRDTPHAVAGGVAIGLVCSFTPLLFFKTLLAVLIAWLCRCSKLSAALSVTFHDVLFPIWPLVVLWQYKIGFYLLSHPHHLPPKVSKHFYENLHHFRYQNIFTVNTIHFLWPTLIGSLIMAVPLAVGAYFLVLKFLVRLEVAKAGKAEVRDLN